MDFLRSPDSDPDRVILLLLVANSGATSLVLYGWDTYQPLCRTKPLEGSGQVLPKEDSFPLMLIPSSRHTSFIIVTEAALTVYDNILVRPVKRIQVALPKYTSADLKYSTRPPVWAQWARAPRLPHHQEAEDNIYLVREDGQIRHYIVKHHLKAKVDSHFSPGYLGINIDTALAIVGPFSQGGDILIAAGDMSDGGVYHLPARQNPTRIQAISNWSPILDMLTIAMKDMGEGRLLRRLSEPERIFTCSGKGKGHSFLNEMRFGIEAQIGWTIDYSDAMSATQLYCLEHPTQTELLVLLSHPIHTGLLAFRLPEMSVEKVDSARCHGLELDETTIAAATLATGHILQITPQRLNLTSLSSEAPAISLEQSDQPFTVAYIDGSRSSFVVANKMKSGFELRIGAIILDSDSHPAVKFAPRAIFLDEEPTALCMATLNGVSIVLAGVGGGQIWVLAADMSQGLELIFKQQLSKLNSGFTDVPLSSLLMLSWPSSPNGIMLVGSRDGKLSFLQAQLEKSPSVVLTVEYEDCIALGSTSVTVYEELVDISSKAALAFCGQQLRRVKLVSANGGLDFQISPIWLSEHGTQSYSQPQINAACRVPAFQTATDVGLTGLLMCAAEKDFLVSALVLQDQAIPRRLHVEGYPQRLTYSRHLNKFIAAVNYLSTLPEADNAVSTQSRLARPALQLINPGPAQIGETDATDKDLIFFGAHGDRVRCILNWTPSDGMKHYDMVLIGVDLDAPDERTRSGKLLCISTKHVGSSGSKSKVKTVSRYPGKPVYSLCAYGRSSLLVAAGNDLILHSLDIDSRRWSMLSSFSLPSPAVALSTQGSFVFAATTRHSLITLKETRGFLNLQASDVKARNGVDVAVASGVGPLLATASIAGTNLIGFSENSAEKRNESRFEAVIPLTINRLRQSFAPSNKPSRQYYYGSTIDGTFYRFIIIGRAEWKLLRFLEDLTPIKSVDEEHSDSESSDLSGGSWDVDSPDSSPRQSTAKSEHAYPLKMHVRGDILAMLLEQGDNNLWNLLRPEVKLEGDIGHDETRERYAEFQNLAREVVGIVAEPVLAVSRWLRKLLRIPQ